MNWFLKALRQYADFSGRAQRSEYWFFILFYVLIFIALVFVDGLVGSYRVDAGIGLLSGIYSLGMVIPSIAVAIRRLHDTDRTGWWVLLCLIPIIGSIVLIVFFVQDSTPDNRFGRNPKGTGV